MFSSLTHRYLGTPTLVDELTEVFFFSLNGFFF